MPHEVREDLIVEIGDGAPRDPLARVRGRP
jgi:hypothetical protein